MADIVPMRPIPIEPRWAKLVPIANLAEMGARRAPERLWALDDWLPLSQATYITGPGSAGKSLLGQQMATCAAAGLPFMGVAMKPANAIYLTCEDDGAELHRRQEAICAALGVDMAGLDGKLHLVSLAGHIGTELATFQKSETDEMGITTPIIRPTDRYRAIEATAIANDVGFIVLDNVAHLFTGNENIRNEVASFMALMNQLAQRTSGSVLLIGHPNKAGDSFSGSTAWENQVRSRIYLETPKDDDGAAIDTDARVLSRQKSNYAANGATLKFRWHRWAFVDEASLPADYQKELQQTIDATRDNRRFLACLAKVTEERRTTSPNKSAPNYAPRVFATMPTAKGLKIKALEQALQRLLHLGEVQADQKLWKRSNRTWATGLAPTQDVAQSPAHHVAQSLHRTLAK